MSNQHQNLNTCRTHILPKLASTAAGATDDAVDIAAMVYYIVAVGHRCVVRCSDTRYTNKRRRDQ